MTPVLAALRSCGGDGPFAPLLVNSESPVGCGHDDLRLKPDLFRSWAPFVKLRAGGEGQGVSAAHVFGVLGGTVLQHAGVVTEVYDAKCAETLTQSHFGELCAYHDCLAGVCRGVLFGPREFWLYKTVSRCPVQLVRGLWAAPCSAAAFRAFFDPRSALGDGSCSR